MPGGCHVPNTNTYRPAAGHNAETLADAVASRIEFEGPDTVAAVLLEPVQNAGGCLIAPEGYFRRVREICDAYDVLFVSDEVICAWGRLGHMFGCRTLRLPAGPDHTAKGITSAYAPMGAVIASDRVAEPFVGSDAMFLHGFTFSGHPVSAAVALANIDVIDREDLLQHVRENEGGFRAMLESLCDIPIVGEVRGAGYFQAIELVKDRGTREPFSLKEAAVLANGRPLAAELFQRGLICRADHRGNVVLQLAPPLIAAAEQFDQMEAILRPVRRGRGARPVAVGLDARRRRQHQRHKRVGEQLGLALHAAWSRDAANSNASPSKRWRMKRATSSTVMPSSTGSPATAAVRFSSRRSRPNGCHIA